MKCKYFVIDCVVVIRASSKPIMRRVRGRLYLRYKMKMMKQISQSIGVSVVFQNKCGIDHDRHRFTMPRVPGRLYLKHKINLVKRMLLKIGFFVTFQAVGNVP